jgi:ATP-binding cassette subfamily B (MDR/TAP) protein 1
LVERFYDSLVGIHVISLKSACRLTAFQLDDKLITDPNVQEYRKPLALVSQQPTLYAGSVRFNILLGAIKPESEATQEEIKNACHDANILDFQSLPKYVECYFLYAYAHPNLYSGFDTEVSGKGSQLSGWQKHMYFFPVLFGLTAHNIFRTHRHCSCSPP